MHIWPACMLILQIAPFAKPVYESANDFLECCAACHDVPKLCPSIKLAGEACAVFFITVFSYFWMLLVCPSLD